MEYLYNIPSYEQLTGPTLKMPRKSYFAEPEFLKVKNEAREWVDLKFKINLALKNKNFQPKYQDEYRL